MLEVTVQILCDWTRLHFTWAVVVFWHLFVLFLPICEQTLVLLILFGYAKTLLSSQDTYSVWSNSLVIYDGCYCSKSSFLDPVVEYKRRYFRGRLFQSILAWGHCSEWREKQTCRKELETSLWATLCDFTVSGQSRTWTFWLLDEWRNWIRTCTLTVYFFYTSMRTFTWLVNTLSTAIYLLLSLTRLGHIVS